eukprot:9278621-Pyramimonas_sp.AAC.1
MPYWSKHVCALDWRSMPCLEAKLRELQQQRALANRCCMHTLSGGPASGIQAVGATRVDRQSPVPPVVGRGPATAAGCHCCHLSGCASPLAIVF